MKKLVLTLVMGVFAFGMSGYSLNNPSLEQECATMAWNAVNDLPSSVPEEFVMEAMDFMYDSCVNGISFKLMVIPC